MQLLRGVSFLFGILFSMALAGMASDVVFAEDTLDIGISPEPVEINLLPGEFGEESQIITASTTNEAGYKIVMRTTGPSSALINTDDDDYTIPTFTLPTGAESIPVGELGDGYGYSVDGGANYLPVPEPSTRATTLFKTTSAGSNTHELTFGVKVPDNAVAGTYVNTFEIRIVANLEPCEAESICYYGNGDDETGSMENQLVDSDSEATLIPSNFSRPGYGFAGWNTEIDGMGTNYGPSQTITVGDLSEEGLQLYAMWVESEGNLQNWKGCGAMNEGDITALTDTRDGSTYAVAKYADGKCWMMENLRLDLSDPDMTISAQNTNKPTSDFMTAANAHPASSNSFCTNNNNSGCVNSLLYNTNNLNRELPASYEANNSGSQWYSYGVYYNYYTATAGNGGYDISTRGQVSGDICPAGWRLPTGYTKKDDLGVLDVAYGGSGSSQEEEPEGSIGSKRWRNYPLNFIFSGEQNGASGYNRGISTGMNTASNNAAGSSFNLWLRKTAINIVSNNTGKSRGQTIRCVAREDSDIVGNIHYEGNGGIGTMADEMNVNFTTTLAASSQFTRTNYIFNGWNTSANGQGVSVPAGGAVDNAARQLHLVDGDTLTLYAMWRPVYRVVYADNGADEGSMASIVHENVTTGVSLTASNYSKIGFGFAGWSPDADAGTKLLNHESVTVYGPNQTATVNNEFTKNADANNQITLYAVWLPEDTTDTLQSFSSSRCDTMSTGEYLALRDERDSNVYAVSKLVDGHCWMTENLRLIPSAVAFSSANTNNPTSTFIDEAASSGDSTTLCNKSTSACIDQVLFNANNINRSLTAAPKVDNNRSSWYSYGVMYGWYAATAGNGNYAMASGNVAGDICPAGWRLPTGGTGGEYANLVNSVGGATASAANERLLSFPNNFIYSGDYNYNTSGGRGTYGRYWSATPDDVAKAFRLGVAIRDGATPLKSWDKWDAFAVRCILK